MKEYILSWMYLFFVSMQLCKYLIDLRLYNHTCNGVTGFHYDPVFLRRLRPRGGAPASTNKNQNQLAVQLWGQPRLRQTCQKASALCGVARGQWLPSHAQRICN